MLYQTFIIIDSLAFPCLTATFQTVQLGTKLVTIESTAGESEDMLQDLISA